MWPDSPETSLSEKEYRAVVESRLEPHFHLEGESWGTCAIRGHRLRVDQVIRPRDVSGWKSPDVKLAIEFKKFKKTKHEEVGDMIRRGLEYRVTEYDDHGWIPVFLYGFALPAEEISLQLGNCDVGEIVFAKHGLEIRRHRKYRLWSDAEGLTKQGRAAVLKIPVGSQKKRI